MCNRKDLTEVLLKGAYRKKFRLSNMNETIFLEKCAFYSKTKVQGYSLSRVIMMLDRKNELYQFY